MTILKCIGLKAWKSFICKFDGNNVNKLQNFDTIFKKLSSKNVQRIYYQNFDVDDQAEQGAVIRVITYNWTMYKYNFCKTKFFLNNMSLRKCLIC